ncbi:hypothetical protein [Ectobacillus panaciterrae]|uniref:hypothetical protein n=1 Tax=Ectobacillus panaciterrae TaxID=363872 RepID=UPI00042A7F28|nr:hypothetical protein [Ectobacillus panaciterrae]
MKRSETIVSRRLRQISVVGLLLMLILTARFGYMKFLYGNGFLLEKKRSVEVMNTNVIENLENSFDLKLRGFHETKIDELIDLSKDDPSVLSLIGLIDSACSNKCEGESSAFIKIDTGYIFYKESGGKNVALHIKKGSDGWEVVNQMER